MRKVSQYDAEIKLTRSVVLKVVELEHDLFYYSEVSTTNTDTASGTLIFRAANSIETKHGFVNDENMTRKLEGHSYRTLNLMVVDENFWSLLANSEKHHSEIVFESTKSEHPTFETIASSNFNLDRLIRWCNQQHLIYDRHGHCVPISLKFGYIGTDLDEEHYDLVEAAKILNARPDIVMYNYRDQVSTDPKDQVIPIDYYNQTPGRSLTISFKWKPTKTDWQRVYAKASNTKFLSPECIKKTALELDLFEIKTARR